MPFLRFQALLSAGYRLRAREQMLAVNAAAFPHMKDKARERAVRELEQAAQPMQGPQQQAASQGDGWAGLRAMVTRDRAHAPLTTAAKEKLQQDHQRQVERRGEAG
jgi:hypothetical protein